MRRSTDMSRRGALGALAAGVAVGGGLWPRGARAQAATVRFGTFVGPTSFLNTDIFFPWFEMIQEQAGDTLKVEILSGGSAAQAARGDGRRQRRHHRHRLGDHGL